MLVLTPFPAKTGHVFFLTKLKAFVIVSLFLLFCLSCGNAKKPYNCEKPPFPIPLDVTTVEGDDPCAKVRPQPVADIYWDNTQSQEGYSLYQGEEKKRFTQFFRIITSLSVGPNYKPKYWTLMPDGRKLPDGRKPLHWGEVKELDPENHNFYTREGAEFEGSIENRERGPLTMIYDRDLINPKNLSIVISDLEEQGLNMSLLTDLIRNKLLKNDDYSALVIATKLFFNGTNFRPDFKKLKDMAKLELKDKEKPLYAIVSGPRDAVKSFSNRFKNHAEKQKLEYYTVTTIQKGDGKVLDIFKDVNVPKTASKNEVSFQVKKAGIIPTPERMEAYNASKAKERIWNLVEKTDSTIDYLGIPNGERLEKIDETLGLRIFEYKMELPTWKNNNWLWALNVGFELPKGVKIENLECSIKNYRYLKKMQKKIEDGEDALEEFEDSKDGELSKKVAFVYEWNRNDEFIRKGLEIYASKNKDTNNCVLCVYPKHKYGELESSAVCFDIIVKTKKKIEIPDWVDKFDDTDFAHPEKNQDKTYNFKEFVNNLLKDEVVENVEYVNDELLRLPVMLFNMPFESDDVR